HFRHGGSLERAAKPGQPRNTRNTRKGNSLIRGCPRKTRNTRNVWLKRISAQRFPRVSRVPRAVPVFVCFAVSHLRHFVVWLQHAMPVVQNGELRSVENLPIEDETIFECRKKCIAHTLPFDEGQKQIRTARQKLFVNLGAAANKDLVGKFLRI